MKQYLELGQKIFHQGNTRGDRTGTGTRSLFGQQMRFDLSEGFPLVTTKPVHLKSIIVELLWFLNGSTNNNLLKEQGVNIWNEWALSRKTERTVEERLQLIREHYSVNGVPLTIKGTTHEEIDEQLVHLNASVKGVNPLTCDRWNRAPEDGELGPVYGRQWRSWPARPYLDREAGSMVQPTIDQIEELITGLKTKPYSRRHIVSGWNPADMPDESKSHEENVSNDKQALPPCHTIFQFYVEDRNLVELLATLGQEFWKQMFVDLAIDDGKLLLGDEFLERQRMMLGYIESKGVPMRKLSCQLYQRAADWCLGVPFNIASYSLLTMMVAQCVDMLPGEFVHTFGDSHIYKNHLETWEKVQSIRAPRELPRMKINPDVKDIFSFKYEDFTLEGYDPVLPAIKYKVAV